MLRVLLSWPFLAGLDPQYPAGLLDLWYLSDPQPWSHHFWEISHSHDPYMCTRAWPRTPCIHQTHFCFLPVPQGAICFIEPCPVNSSCFHCPKLWIWVSLAQQDCCAQQDSSILCCTQEILPQKTTTGTPGLISRVALSLASNCRASCYPTPENRYLWHLAGVCNCLLRKDQSVNHLHLEQEGKSSLETIPY